MKKFRKGARLLPAVMLALCLSALTGCSLFKPAPPPVVLQESVPAHLSRGTPTPFDGWLLSESSLAKLLERAENCK